MSLAVITGMSKARSESYQLVCSGQQLVSENTFIVASVMIKLADFAIFKFTLRWQPAKWNQDQSLLPRQGTQSLQCRSRSFGPH